MTPVGVAYRVRTEMGLTSSGVCEQPGGDRKGRGVTCLN